MIMNQYKMLSVLSLTAFTASSILSIIIKTNIIYPIILLLLGYFLGLLKSFINLLKVNAKISTSKNTTDDEINPFANVNYPYIREEIERRKKINNEIEILKKDKKNVNLFCDLKEEENKFNKSLENK